MNKKDRDILDIAIPSIVSNITVPLLGLVDVTIVGHMGNAAYIAAIAVGSMIFNVIYWIFGFLRMG
ncbi:MAG: MATE family efflux transporter, partial [Prevotellaceae bacterium]|nr:MATE family efflux transporter [Prevotellaceae bacterium]